VASAGPCASLHLAPDRQPHQHPTTLFFTGRMPFLLPNQQHQSTEGVIMAYDYYCYSYYKSTDFLLIGWGLWILCGVEHCHLPLTKPVAVNTCWCYRAARDYRSTDDSDSRTNVAQSLYIVTVGRSNFCHLNWNVFSCHRKVASADIVDETCGWVWLWGLYFFDTFDILTVSFRPL